MDISEDIRELSYDVIWDKQTLRIRILTNEPKSVIIPQLKKKEVQYRTHWQCPLAGPCK